MADVQVVAVRLKAINDDFRKGMAEAGDSTLAMSKVAAVGFAALGVAAAGMALKAANATVDYTKNIMAMARVSGDSIQTMSKLAFAGQQFGVSTETITAGLRFMEKNMISAPEKFQKLGVSVTDASGKVRSSHDVLLDTADAIRSLGSGAERTNAIVAIFGRGGLEMGKLVLQGKAAILETEAAAKSYGLELSDANVAAVQKNIKAHREFDAALLGAKLRIGQDMLPALTWLTEGFAKLPGPVSAGIAPVAGVTGGLLALAAVGPKIAGTLGTVTKGMDTMGKVSAAGLLAADVAILAYSQHVHDLSDEVNRGLTKDLDFTDQGKAEAGVKKEYEAAKKLADAFDSKSWNDKLGGFFLGERRTAMDAVAQLEENQKRLETYKQSATAVGRELGITGEAAAEMASKLHLDLTTMSPGKYIPILKAFTAGHITAAEATNQLAAAQLAAAGTADEQAKAIKALHDEVKAANDEEKASIQPQLDFADALRKQQDATRKVEDARRGIVDADRAVADSQLKVGDATRKREDADRKETDAIRAQSDAQRELNDLLRGPSVDEQLNIEAAQIALEEAKRKAAGVTGTDPQLEARKNALDVRRAEIGLSQAEGAHDKAVEAAKQKLASATQSVADAHQAALDAAKNEADAHRNVEDAVRKDEDAHRNLDDAQLAVYGSALKVDEAQRNLAVSMQTGEVSTDKTKDALKRWADQGLISTDQAWKMYAALVAVNGEMDKHDPNAAPQTGSAGVHDTASDYGLGTGVAGGVTGHYMGGNLNEGMNLLGERGPELAYKRGSNVSVITADRTRGLLTPHSAMAAGMGGSGSSKSYSPTYQIHADTSDEALERARRRDSLTLASL